MAPQVVTTIAAAPSMFRTLGVEILRGRGFDDRDGPAAPRVVVLSEFTARQMFGTADAVGRGMARGAGQGPRGAGVGSPGGGGGGGGVGPAAARAGPDRRRCRRYGRGQYLRGS